MGYSKRKIYEQYAWTNVVSIGFRDTEYGWAERITWPAPAVYQSER